MPEKNFPEGINVQRPKDGAPAFVKARVWIRKGEFVRWLTTQAEDSVNLDLMESRNGKLYLAVDDWKPDNQNQPKEAPGFEDDPLPF